MRRVVIIASVTDDQTSNCGIVRCAGRPTRGVYSSADPRLARFAGTGGGCSISAVARAMVNECAVLVECEEATPYVFLHGVCQLLS